MKKKNETSLSKFLAQAGIASRRKVVDIIKAGKITVNDNVITEPGFKITSKDIVKVSGQEVTQPQKIYILLNKPKNYITTVSDERGRKTVIDLLSSHIKERIYPVGRLDRNTTGLLLLTNDGELAQQLAHPKYEVEKVYHVQLDKPLTQRDAQKIIHGIELEDGLVTVDDLYFVRLPSKRSVAVVLHSGKYRVVRRIFEYLGYKVEKLDRVMYAGLTKKGLKVGSFRFLTDQEITQLKQK